MYSLGRRTRPTATKCTSDIRTLPNPLPPRPSSTPPQTVSKLDLEAPGLSIQTLTARPPKAAAQGKSGQRVQELLDRVSRQFRGGGSRRVEEGGRGGGVREGPYREGALCGSGSRAALMRHHDAVRNAISRGRARRHLTSLKCAAW